MKRGAFLLLVFIITVHLISKYRFENDLIIVSNSSAPGTFSCDYTLGRKYPRDYIVKTVYNSASPSDDALTLRIPETELGSMIEHLCIRIDGISLKTTSVSFDPKERAVTVSTTERNVLFYTVILSASIIRNEDSNTFHWVTPAKKKSIYNGGSILVIDQMHFEE